jgi:hypothetical protein
MSKPKSNEEISKLPADEIIQHLFSEISLIHAEVVALRYLIEGNPRKVAQAKTLLNRREKTDPRVADLQNSIIRRISDRWESQKLPLGMTELSRMFSKSAKRYFGSLDELLTMMDDSDQLRSVMRVNGTKVFIPIEIVEGITSEQLELIREFELTPEQVKRFRAQERKAIDLAHRAKAESAAYDASLIESSENLLDHSPTVSDSSDSEERNENDPS